MALKQFDIQEERQHYSKPGTKALEQNVPKRHNSKWKRVYGNLSHVAKILHYQRWERLMKIRLALSQLASNVKIGY